MPKRAATGPGARRAPERESGAPRPSRAPRPRRGARRGVHGASLLPLRRRRRDPGGPRGRWFTSASISSSSAAGSPLAVDLEVLCARWLCELFELPADELTGVFVTGATAANTVGLGAARQRVLARVGHDAAERGLAGAPEVRVLTGGFVHASVVKACAVLGLGRASIERFSADNRGTLDEAALARRLEEPGRAGDPRGHGRGGEQRTLRPLDRPAESRRRRERGSTWTRPSAPSRGWRRASEQVRPERAD